MTFSSSAEMLELASRGGGGVFRRAGADDCGGDLHGDCRAGCAHSTRSLPPLAGREADLVLDHDLVSLRTGGADRSRNLLPRPGLVLGLAVEMK